MTAHDDDRLPMETALTRRAARLCVEAEPHDHPGDLWPCDVHLGEAARQLDGER